MSNPYGDQSRMSFLKKTAAASILLASAGIKWVSLCYRSVNQDMEYQTMQMLLTGEKDTFEATVPANQIDPKFDFMYFIKVVDNERRGIIYPDLNKETPYIIVKLLR